MTDRVVGKHVVRTVISATVCVVILMSSAIAKADLREDARRIIEQVDRLERSYRPLAELQPSPRLSPKRREAFLNLVSREQTLLDALPPVRLYATKVELGDHSAETIRLLNTFLHRKALAENEVGEAGRAFVNTH